MFLAGRTTPHDSAQCDFVCEFVCFSCKHGVQGREGRGGVGTCSRSESAGDQSQYFLTDRQLILASVLTIKNSVRSRHSRSCVKWFVSPVYRFLRTKQ